MAAGRALLGLGEGLTPSGDDFLSGMLFCLHTLDKLYPALGLDLSSRPRFTEAARRKTHPISYALLVDAAFGQAVEPLYGWLCAVFSDRAPAGIGQAAARLTHIGHSTGWDLLAGALTGLLPALRGTQEDIEDKSSRTADRVAGQVP